MHATMQKHQAQVKMLGLYLFTCALDMQSYMHSKLHFRLYVFSTKHWISVGEHISNANLYRESCTAGFLFILNRQFFYSCSTAAIMQVHLKKIYKNILDSLHVQ